jgi:hypothetical protein
VCIAAEKPLVSTQKVRDPLMTNQWRCPLTSIAARYTDERRDNFDIYLPEWLAKHNKSIFGVLYVAVVVFALVQWVRAPG